MSSEEQTGSSENTFLTPLSVADTHVNRKLGELSGQASVPVPEYNSAANEEKKHTNFQKCLNSEVWQTQYSVFKDILTHFYIPEVSKRSIPGNYFSKHLAKNYYHQISYKTQMYLFSFHNGDGVAPSALRFLNQDTRGVGSTRHNLQAFKHNLQENS